LFIRNKFISLKQEEKEYAFNIEYTDKTIYGDVHLAFVYQLFETSRSLESAHEEHGVPMHILRQLADQLFLVEAEYVDIFSKGLLETVELPIGAKISLPEFSKIEVQKEANQFVVVGIPVDLCGQYGGARLGPKIMRSQLEIVNQFKNEKQLCDFDKRKIYDLEDLQCFDLGDVVRLPAEGIDAVAQRASYVYDRIFNQNWRCITFGGDHSVSLFPISCLAKNEKIHLIQFDAHHDFYGDKKMHSELSHANWAHQIIDLENIISITQIGLRTFEFVNNHDFMKHPKWHFVSSRDVKIKDRSNFFSHIPRNEKVYVSFDIDCLDYQLVHHETGIPEIGGLGFYDISIVLDEIFDAFNVRGFDVVELSETNANEETAAKIASKIILDYLLHRAAFKAF
jgi:agmatinase